MIRKPPNINPGVFLLFYIYKKVSKDVISEKCVIFVPENETILIKLYHLCAT